ncbi:hypothetical protein NGF69_16685 [Enterococcus casseliflavus]|nr:hypothetical protein [Enterococcus casseliflavus]
MLTFDQLQQRLNEGCLGGMSIVCFISLSHEFPQVRRNYQRRNGQIVSLFQFTD